MNIFHRVFAIIKVCGEYHCMNMTYEEALFMRTKVIGYVSNFRENILKAFRINQLFAENKIKKYNNCKEARRQSGKVSIKDLFIHYWNDFKVKYFKQLTRQSIIDNVEKMIKCGSFDVDNGYLYFECPNPVCSNFHIQPFTCKSRFCPSCGKKYNDARVKEICKKCIDVTHRHITFTISEKLRNYFLLDRTLIDCLFEAVEDTFNYMSHKAAPNKEYKFGFISTLHTFGRDLKFNPHLHVLIAECVIDKDNEIKKWEYFNYEQMRKSFQKALLDRMTHRINTAQFRKVKNEIYSTSKNGFYVHGPKYDNEKIKSKKDIVKYVVRYAGHPAISESRIISIDYINNIVSYYYDPHEDTDGHTIEKKGRQFIKEPVDEFIKKLIIHIPENGKHNIRYYGFYANKSSKRPIIRKIKWPMYTSKAIKAMISELSWRDKILKTFDYDILMCDRCGKTLVLVPDLCYIPASMKRKRNYG